MKLGMFCLLKKLDCQLNCSPHCVACRVGLLSFILSHYKLLKKYLHKICTCYSELIIFQRALFTLNLHYSWKTSLADMQEDCFLRPTPYLPKMINFLCVCALIYNFIPETSCSKHRRHRSLYTTYNSVSIAININNWWSNLQLLYVYHCIYLL